MKSEVNSEPIERGIVMTKKTSQLRQLYTSKEIFVLPGVVNAFEAKIVQAAGFKACYMSGGRTSSAYGYPDVGFTTMTEIVTNARYIAAAIDLPLLSDADTGYGNALNVRRTVQEFIRAGVAGIHMEDQVFPKRCGYMPGKQVIEMEEAVRKFHAAVDARNELDPDFVLVARTDALGAVGGTLDEAVRRAEAYRKVGTDVTYIEGVHSMEQVRFIIERVEKPIMLITAGIPLEEGPSEEEMERMGIACVFYPGIIVELITPLLWEYLHDVNARGVTALREWHQWWGNFPRKYPPAPPFFKIDGFMKVKEWEEKYLSEKEMEKYLKSTGIAFGESQSVGL